MAITTTEVTQRTGETYTTGTNPTTAQVTAFILGAKNAYKGETGVAVDETSQEEVEIVLDIVEVEIFNYKVTEALKNTLQSQVFQPPKLSPLVSEETKLKIKAHVLEG